MISPLHYRLREATKAPHRDLDRHPLLMPLVRDEVTREYYGCALLALHSIYAVLEDAVDGPATQAGFDYASRRKAPAMEADLRDLGLDPRPTLVVVEKPLGIGALVGILYTLEGSTIGAQAICHHLSSGPSAAFPMRYFSGYGDATLQRWREFWVFAETACPVEEVDAACRSAVGTFGGIKRHLDDVLESEK